ncbi:hypothetical protein BV898_07153 [Hypsibius exemplaris]|uniref:Uncharacterized protein n=1 Tax=Hypsibius exemplaris TaxID=2072580 RepID=A0A1W0WU33_HYPEX|nr:hypothetical protein BV898_07153 [Hypsibius exemplaris]
MLIPYDNDVIPIPRDLRRRFEDDDPSIRPYTAGSAVPPPAAMASAPLVTPIQNAESPQLTTEDVGRPRSTQTPEMLANIEQTRIAAHSKPLTDLRLPSDALDRNDMDLAMNNYTAFNAYFYKPQRDIFGRPETEFRSLPQKSMFKPDPLVDDPRKSNTLSSVVKSIKLDGKKAPAEGAGKTKPSKLPVPETLLADAKGNLRWGEVSCWDFMVKKEDETAAENVEQAKEAVHFRWITHGEFNVDVAIANLEEFFLKKWMRGAHWRVHIELQTRKFKPDGVTAYIFETTWSIPTRKQPVAKATGSIFFVMDVCSNKKPEAPVIVSCHYENSPMIFDPLKIKFGAEILTDIMERKRLLAERLIY